MNGLAVGLLGLAALCAERGLTWSRRAETRARLRPPYPSSRRRALDRRAMLAPAAGALAGFVITGPVGLAVGIALGVAARRLGERRRRHRIAALIDEQIADVAAGIAAAVRSGMSLAQALAYVADEAEPPARDGLVDLIADLEVGVRLDDALDGWVRGVDTDDARLLGAALALHRRTGGDLPRVLDQVVATIRERVDVAREVRGLTAQGRLSGLILGLLPVAFFAFLWITSRQDMQAALSTPAGAGAVVLGVTMEIGAFVWIRKLLEVV